MPPRRPLGPRGGLDPGILAFDTSLPHVSVAVLSGRVRAERTEPMARGQDGRLMPLIAEVLEEAGGRLQDMDLIAVGVGPGNFTGTRIAVAAARGLALALGIPATGVSLFEALLDPVAPTAARALLVSLEAPRGQAYVQHFRHGRPQAPPRLVDPASPPPDLGPPRGMAVRGYMAEAIARPFHASWEEAAPARVAARVAEFAERRLRQGPLDPALRPAPLYVRPPDAAPPADPPPPIVP